MTHVEKIRQYAPHLDAPIEAALVEAMEISDTKGVRALPGAAQLLGWGWPVAIVTSATRRLANVRLMAAGLEPPGVMVCAEDVTHGKPHPEPYRRAADLLGVPPHGCIAFEDAPAGVAAAVAAGTHVVAITSTVGALWLAGAHEVVPNLAAYLAVLSESARMSAAPLDPGSAGSSVPPMGASGRAEYVLPEASMPGIMPGMMLGIVMS